MSDNSMIAMAMVANRLLAVEGFVDGMGVRVERSLDVTLPENEADVGGWLKDRLREAGMKSRRAILGLDRQDVLVKRLTFPALPANASDLASMVNLQMARQMVTSTGGISVDHVASQHAGDAGVLSAGITGDRLASLIKVARSAGLKVERATPLCCGYGVLGRGPGSAGHGAQLGIASSADGVEYLVIDAGEIMLSRWVSSPTQEVASEAGAEGLDPVARFVATESRRTLMSHGAGAGARPVSSAFVVGDDARSRTMAAACGEMTGLGCVCVGPPEGVTPGALPTSSDARMLALVGLLIEQSQGTPRLDLADPRRPVDRAARFRQMSMAAMLGLVLLVGGLFTWGSLQRREAERELQGVETLHAELTASREKALRDEVRLDHIRQWKASGPDWLAHLAGISDIMPGEAGVLRELRGNSARTSVTYTKKGGEYDSKGWKSDASVGVTVKGLARSVDASEQVRGAFVEDARYTVFPVGQDGVAAKDPQFPVSFGLDLQSGGLTRALNDGGKR